MKEEYKDIEGYEGLYQVSNLGNIKSLGNDKARKDKILKPAKHSKGYLIVCLSKQGKHKLHKILLIISLYRKINFSYDSYQHI